MKIFFSLTIAFLFFSCAEKIHSMESASKQTDASVILNAHKWYLKKIYKDTDTTEVINKKAFIQLDSANGKVGGNGSCNSFGGALTLDGEKISISKVFSTKMFCEGVQQTEDNFLKQLEKVNRFEIKDTVLLLYQDEQMLLEFERE
jgi:heat shock protein HslJ